MYYLIMRSLTIFREILMKRIYLGTNMSSLKILLNFKVFSSLLILISKEATTMYLLSGKLEDGKITCTPLNIMAID